MAVLDIDSEIHLRDAVGRLENAGIDQPLLEAELLLALAAGVKRLDVLVGLSRPLTATEQEQFEALISRRCSREPLAYIRQSQEFYGLDFEIGPGVLIPRPETELLVDLAQEMMGDRGGTVMDIGTGSGCIAVAAAVRMQNVRVVATESSDCALPYARRNAARHGTADRIEFVRASGLDSIEDAAISVILSNPPYIPTDVIPTLQPEVRNYEPRQALDGGRDGLAIIRTLVTQSPRVLQHDGWLAIEVGLGQAANVMELMLPAGFLNIASRKDLAGIDRVVIGRKS